jgi:hypothetical protein
MILHGYVKKCNYKKLYKMWFLLEEGRFYNIFDDKPSNDLLQNKKTIKIYTHK